MPSHVSTMEILGGSVLTGVATALGLALAFAGVRFVAWWNPASVPRVAGVRLDLNVLIFTAIVAVITSVVFSLAPALRALRVDLTKTVCQRLRQCPALWGQRDIAPLLAEEIGAEPLFEMTDMVRHRSMRHAQFVTGTRNTAETGGRLEGAEGVGRR